VHRGLPRSSAEGSPSRADDRSVPDRRFMHTTKESADFPALAQY
jgi:hypothetical protein